MKSQEEKFVRERAKKKILAKGEEMSDIDIYNLALLIKWEDEEIGDDPSSPRTEGGY